MFVEQAHRRLVAEGEHPREHLEGHAAEGVDVGATGDVGGQDLLGGHVAGRPEHHAGLGEGRGPLDLGDAEVEDLDVVGVAVPVEQEHVVRLHVPVDHPGLVGCAQGPGQLDQDRLGPVPADPAVLAQDLAELAAVEVLHHEEHLAGLAATDVDDVDDVGVLDLRGRLGLPKEAFDDARVAGQALLEDLHGDA